MEVPVPDLFLVWPQRQIDVMVGDPVDHHRLGTPAKHGFHNPRSIFRLRTLEQSSLIAPQRQVHIVIIGPELSVLLQIPIPSLFHRFDQGPGGCPFFIIRPHFQDHPGKKEQDNGQEQGVPQSDPERDRQALQLFPPFLRPPAYRELIL